MPDTLTVRLELKYSKDAEEALRDLEDYFVHDGGWWTEPCSYADHLVTELEVDEVSFLSLNSEEFIEALGLEPEWVLECYEV